MRKAELVASCLVILTVLSGLTLLSYATASRETNSFRPSAPNASNTSVLPLGITNSSAFFSQVLSHQFSDYKDKNWSMTLRAIAYVGVMIPASVTFPNGTAVPFTQNLLPNGTSTFSFYAGPVSPSGMYTVTFDVAASTVLQGGAWAVFTNYNWPVTSLP